MFVFNVLAFLSSFFNVSIHRAFLFMCACASYIRLYVLYTRLLASNLRSPTRNCIIGPMFRLIILHILTANPHSRRHSIRIHFTRTIFVVFVRQNILQQFTHIQTWTSYIHCNAFHPFHIFNSDHALKKQRSHYIKSTALTQHPLRQKRKNRKSI